MSSSFFCGGSLCSRLTESLPADPIPDNYPRQVWGAAYSYVSPKKVKSPALVAASPSVARLLGIKQEGISSDEFLQQFVGNTPLGAIAPYATCYGGHQFGNWAAQLGDGRAINIGDIKTAAGQYFSLQLKGAGPTPYSRTADGFAVLRSSIREYLCSEAMHALGVPTTRALSLVLTGEQVRRDMFYDGNPQWEQGAVVCRVAPSFTRFGHFELPSARQDIDLLKAWVDFTIETDFSDLQLPKPFTNEHYVKWFARVCELTAVMVAHWMRVGFVHGVMNTDNMSILGLTIDYGPYGWIDNYDPNWTPNTTDAHGKRYRFGAQPQVALWNLAQLGNALYPLVNAVEPLQEALDVYRKTYAESYQDFMHKKLGLFSRLESDQHLFDQLHQLLQQQETDMTLFYRLLSNVCLSDSPQDALVKVEDSYYMSLSSTERDSLCAWLGEYIERIQVDFIKQGVTDPQRKQLMDSVNPKYVLRNYLAQQAIELAEQGDYSEVHQLQKLLENPYSEQPEYHYYFARRPDWATQKAGCSMLSCSS